MKHLPLRTAAGALFAVALTAPAFAAPSIDITMVNNVANAPSVLNAFTAGKRGFVTEDFEDFTPTDGAVATSEYTGDIATRVGSFNRAPTAVDGSGVCIFDCENQQILSTATTPFSGRQDTTNGAGAGQWLDSNDVSALEWVFDVSDETSVSNADYAFDTFTHFAFFLTDVSDVGATLTVTFQDGVTVSESISGQGNGAINFVTASLSGAATSATVTMANSGNRLNRDGFGIDDVTIAVPVPATLGLLGLGLVGLGALARRRHAV